MLRGKLGNLVVLDLELSIEEDNGKKACELIVNLSKW